MVSSIFNTATEPTLYTQVQTPRGQNNQQQQAYDAAVSQNPPVNRSYAIKQQQQQQEQKTSKKQQHKRSGKNRTPAATELTAVDYSVTRKLTEADVRRGTAKKGGASMISSDEAARWNRSSETVSCSQKTDI